MKTHGLSDEILSLWIPADASYSADAEHETWRWQWQENGLHLFSTLTWYGSHWRLTTNVMHNGDSIACFESESITLGGVIYKDGDRYLAWQKFIKTNNKEQ